MKNISIQNNKTAAIYLFPALLLISIFYIYPMIYLLYLSFYKWNGISSVKKFIGIQNYAELLSSPEFANVLVNTFNFIFLTVPVGVVISLLLALLIHEKVRHIAFFRVSLFLPVIISTVGSSLAWKFIYNYQNGILNRFLEFISIESINWLGNDKWVMISIAVTTIWKNAGYNMIIFLAGLNSIPPIYYEAAAVDGITNSWVIFTKVTWPQLKGVTLVVTIMSVIYSFKSFDQIYIMTGGGPVGSTTILVYYIYEKGFKYFEMGIASAVSIVMLTTVLILTWIQIRIGNA